MNKKELYELIDKIDGTGGGNVKLDISVYIETEDGEIEPPPVDSDYYKAVLLVEKPSNRTKIWLSPKIETPSGYFVWNGDTVEKIPGGTATFTKVKVISGGSQGQSGWTQNDEMSYEKM